MRLSRIVVGLALLSVMAILCGCESTPTHTFYIGEEGCCATSVDGDKIDKLWMFPGDQVIWINTASKDMTVSFDSDVIFGVSEFTVTSGKRVKMTVEADASVTVDYSISPCNGAPGTPKAVVEDEP
jgi:hypothetical protein